VSWLQAATLASIEVEAALSYLDRIWPGLANASGALTERGLGIAVALIAVFTVVNSWVCSGWPTPTGSWCCGRLRCPC
jgi:hypothetical protein